MSNRKSKTEKKTEKKIARQMHVQFGVASLVCFVVIAVLCAGALWICRGGFLLQGISFKEKTDEAAAEIAEKIDNIIVERAADSSDLKKIKQAYKELSQKQQEQVKPERYDKLSEAIWLAEQMGEQKIGLVVKDKSKNGFDMKFTEQEGAGLKAYDGRAAFEGQADVSENGAKALFDRLLDGTHSFTVEAELNPNGGDDFNMILSKGDNCTALRISEHSVYFFIKEKNSDWKGARSALSGEQMSSWVHTAGVYRSGYVSSYLEGSGMITEKVNAFLPSEYPLGIGYCPELNRKSVASIRKLRIYAKPLTEEELEEGRYEADSDCVELWYDFDDYYYEGFDVPAEGIRCYENSLKLETGEKKGIPVEMIPYYASGQLVYSSDNPDVAAVSQDGIINCESKGKAVITAMVEGTDYSVEIPVIVGNAQRHIFVPYEQLAIWIIAAGLLLFLLALLLIAMLQRRRLIVYLGRLSDEISVIGGERSGQELPDILGDAENAIQHVEENFRKKDQAAREAEQRKNDLVVYLAHDLKTPIASLIGYLTLLRDEKQISPDLHEHYVEIALNNSERLDELIDEFFEITRFNVSQITLNYERINLTMLMEQLVSEFKPILAEKGLVCRLEMPGDVMVRCDADKMERVFENLLRNAMNYSYRDTEIGILVTVDEVVTVVFINYGEHISKEQLARIFEQFYRLDQARSSSTGGSGLGLAIAKQIVETHRGTICAESIGEEIRFTVRIPVDERARSG